MSKTRKQRGMKPNKPRTPRQISFDLHQRIMNARPGDVIDDQALDRLSAAAVAQLPLPHLLYMGTPRTVQTLFAEATPAEPIDPDY